MNLGQSAPGRQLPGQWIRPRQSVRSLQAPAFQKSEAKHQEPTELLSAAVADRLAALIKVGRTKEAQRMLSAVLDSGISGTRLGLMRKLLEVTVSHGPEVNVQSESGALKFAPGDYRGKWVALRGSMVVASASKLEELRRDLPAAEGLALHWVPSES